MDKNRIEELLELTRVNELLAKKEAANAKKPSNIVLWVLAVFGAIAAVATIAYFVFQYMMPEYEDDYDFDDDDFDDDEAREAVLKVVREALGSADGKVSADDAGHLRRYLYHCAAGIQPGFKGGWDDFELYPQPQEWLKAIDAEKDVAHGKIRSSWKFEDGKCVWKFAIPEGAKATVCVNGMCKRYMPGEYTLEIKK